MIWYFAYGSNLSVDQVQERTGLQIDVQKPRIAKLVGFRLAFNMRGENGQVYANIIRPGEFVLGVIYACELDILEKMDAFEVGYHRESIEVVDGTGASIDPITYVANPENLIEGVLPSAEYVQRILRGGREHGLPETYLRELECLASAAL